MLRMFEVGIGPFQKVIAAGLLLFITVLLSRRFRLGMEADILWSSFRCLLQLLFLGAILEWMFSLKPWISIGLAWFVMLLFGADIVNKRLYRSLGFSDFEDQRSRSLKRKLRYSFFLNLLIMGLTFTFLMGVMIWIGKLAARPEVLIPIGGMVMGNLVMVLSLTHERLISELRVRAEQIESMIGMGVSSNNVVSWVYSYVIRSVLVPRLDNLKATGLVWIPGLMTGLLIAKVSPIEASTYQTMIMWLLFVNAFAASSLTVFVFSRLLFDRMERLLISSG